MTDAEPVVIDITTIERGAILVSLPGTENEAKYKIESLAWHPGIDGKSGTLHVLARRVP